MIRKAILMDCSRMAEIHVFGCRCAYKEFVSIEFLFNKITFKISKNKFMDYLLNIKNKDKAFVFEENNIIKGFMSIIDCRDEDKDEETFELERIYVDPIFQKQKIGTQLVKYCINEGKSRNKKEITLWVFEKNYNSIKFYERMDFKADGKIKINEKYNENVIRMNKML